MKMKRSRCCWLGGPASLPWLMINSGYGPAPFGWNTVVSIIALPLLPAGISRICSFRR
jgi:hypothetical protein